MRKIFSSILMMLCAIAAMAQSDYVATLQHGEDVSYFYGTGAFVAAYNAAAEGDVITLSSGSFTGGTVEKGITVRGAGIDAESQSTSLTGEVKIYSPSIESVVVFEGITFTGNVLPYADGNKAPKAGRIMFVKDYFSGSSILLNNVAATVESTPMIDIVNCSLNGGLMLNKDYSNVKVYNSIIGGGSSWIVRTSQSKVSNTLFSNCIINGLTHDPYDGYYCSFASFANCIFKYLTNNNGSTRLPSSVSCMNCIADNANVFSAIPNYSGMGNQVLSTADFNAMFKSGTFHTTWTKGTTFELTDQAATTYLGVDNTQVGMHGGQYPYNTTVGYPIVTTFNVGSKTTNSGDLNIEVQTNNAE